MRERAISSKKTHIFSRKASQKGSMRRTQDDERGMKVAGRASLSLVRKRSGCASEFHPRMPRGEGQRVKRACDVRAGATAEAANEEIPFPAKRRALSRGEVLTKEEKREGKKPNSGLLLALYGHAPRKDFTRSEGLRRT